MATEKRAAGGELPLPEALPRIKGRVMAYVRQGQVILAGWPKKRTKPPSPAQLEQIAEFKRLVEATKNILPEDAVAARDVALGSKYTWRDVISRAMTGQLVDHPNYGEIVSQYNLDILGDQPGMIVIRANDLWIALPVGTDAQILRVVDGLPAWSDETNELELTGDVTAGPGESPLATTLATTGVTPGTYTFSTITVDAKGRITSAITGTPTAYINQLTGDVTAGPGSGAVAATLANSGVAAGTYTLATVVIDAKGRVTSATSGTPSAAVPGLPWTTGRLYSAWGTYTTATATTNRIFASPLPVPDGVTIDRIATFVTQGVAGGEITMGIYADNNGIPGSLLFTSNAFATTTTSQKREQTGINLLLSKQWVWLAMAVKNGSNAFRSIGVTQGENSPYLGTPNSLTGTQQNVGVIGTYTYVSGVLPDPFPTPTDLQTFCPLVFIGP